MNERPRCLGSRGLTNTSIPPTPVQKQQSQNAQKQIYLLIGQKGSGKSFIGTLVQKHFGIPFIPVEDCAKQIKQDRAVDDESYLRQVFDAIDNGVWERLKQVDTLIFESTGLTSYFDQMLENLKEDFEVVTIDVYADSRVCLDRVKNRDQSIHISISDEQVIMINERVRQRSFETDHRIDNETKSEKELVRELEKIIQSAGVKIGSTSWAASAYNPIAKVSPLVETRFSFTPDQAQP